MAVTSAQVQELYVAYLGRAADKQGLDYWMSELNAEPATMTLESLRANFVNEQQEYANIYGGLSREETIVQIYNNLFGRAPDAEGLAYWTTGGGASVNADQLLVAFINGAAAADAQVVTNKVLVSDIYTQIAGSNFTPADAAAAIAHVGGTTASVSDAIAALNALPGIAVPEAVTLVQAAEVAAAAVVTFEESASKVDALVAINDKVVALDTAGSYGSTPVALNAAAGGDVTKVDNYADVMVTAKNAQDLRDMISTDSTAVLTTKAGEAATELSAARTALVNGVTGALTVVKAYEAAYAADAAQTAPDAQEVGLRVDQLQAVASNTTATWNAAVAKLSAADLAAVDADNSGVVSAQEVYDFLAAEATTTTQISAVNTAFAGVEGFSAVSTLAAQQHADSVAATSLAEATVKVQGLVANSALPTDLDEKFLAAFDANATAKQTLADAKAADALVSDANAIVASHDALVAASQDADAALADSAAVAYSNVNGFVGTAKADVFYFPTGDLTQATDFTVGANATTGFNAGDALYIGQGYTLSSVTQLSDGAIVGGNNSAKEVFFIQSGANVNVVVETAEYGSSTAAANLATSATDNVAVITLAGVSAADLTFSNGVISHV